MYDSFVALGDSFTEGLDDLREDGNYGGWADMVAGDLATRSPDFRYANLAVRGRRLERIRDEQVSPVEEMRPDLVAITAGGNDIIGLRCDVGRLARDLHGILARLVGSAETVVVFTGFNPRGRLPMGRLLAARAAAYNASIRASSAELGSRVVDLWNMSGLYEDRMWARDRLHLSPDGHALVAAAVLHVLGEPPSSDALKSRPPSVAPDWVSARRADAEWFGSYFAPWFARKVRGRSAGDLLAPKRAELAQLPRQRQPTPTAAPSRK